MRLFKIVIASVAVAALVSQPAFAHVTVKPNEAVTGAYQTFTVSVPNEKESATTKIKLVIPNNLESVSPTVKPGWEITTDKEGSGEEAKVKSITWDGGEIPEGQRDDFTFSAKLPDAPTELQWNAYQTYEGNITIAWDKSEADQPKKEDGSPDFSRSGPFSVTQVATEAEEVALTSNQGNGTSTMLSLFMSAAALLVALVGFAIATKKKTKA